MRRTNLNNASSAPINEKLILVRLRLHQWSGRKFDKAASDQLAALHGKEDSTEVGRFNKILVEREALLPVLQARSELLNRHYHMTAPWTDDGVRVLTSDLFFEYTKQLREATAAYEAAARNFAHGAYPAERAKAQERLGTLFRAGDYPSEDEVRDAYGCAIHFEPLPNPEDVRVWGVGEVAAREIEADVRASVQAGIDAAHKHVAGQLIERAQEFVDKVRRYHKGETKGLRETAVENLRAMVEVVLSGLNVKGDQALTDLARQLEVALRDISVDDLRDNKSAPEQVQQATEELRKTKAAEVDRIAGKFAGVFGPPAKVAGGAR